MWMSVDRKSAVPMTRQLYGRIREEILSGRLHPGARLPSSRELASRLQISRNVVLEAYDLLYAEGFLAPKQGDGTYVASGAAFTGPARKAPPVVEKVTMGYDCPPGVINFRAGTPNLKMFPTKLWLQMVKEVLLLPPEEMFAYGHPEGRQELRQAICEYVVSQREVVCHPEQIVITAGTTQAIGIACHLLIGKRLDVVLEDPITRDIQLIVKSHGAILHAVPVDSDGMRTAELPLPLNPTFVYATPSHQFPIGGTMPIQRRIELLRYAETTGAFIIEDDYDSEFRFDGPPLSSLHGLHPDRVVYIGTFSKTLCPAIRIGYLILPPQLIGLGRSRKWQSDLHNEVTSQLALARFIRLGHYLRHVTRMRKHYQQKRNDMAVTLTQRFGTRMEILGSATGLHLVARFPGCEFTQHFFAATEAAGARFYPVATHAMKLGTHRDELLLGYGNISSEEIRVGLAILAKHLDHYRRVPAPS
ncbi:MAG: PLP-dependent aminotransferase family protein [Proteobacteria bacterium]|nr:PLP-dependent aminotransferase family protein [Pseudomonadota bacterium]